MNPVPITAAPIEARFAMASGLLLPAHPIRPVDGRAIVGSGSDPGQHPGPIRLPDPTTTAAYFGVSSAKVCRWRVGAV
jgi:hypothetical protein